jgi:hypothetical protein
MKRFAFGLSLVLAAVAPALADDTTPVTPAAPAAPAMPATPATPSAADPMAGYYGNSVVVIDSKGLESHTYYKADHTFTGVAPAYSYNYQGSWEITADGKLCRTFNPEPPGITNPNCDTFQPHVVGDTWASPDGAKGSLVAGVN